MSAANSVIPVPGNDGVSGRKNNQIQLALEINSCRIIAVADQLAMCAKSFDQPDRFLGLCLSLARGIDYGLANNEVPSHASKLPPVLKMVCSRKDHNLQPAIMALMISVKNACKLNWFTAKDTEELLTLADEVARSFVTEKNVNTEICSFLPTVSTIISRYYPRYKLGSIIASVEVEAGKGIHLVDFHISRDINISKGERLYLFVASKDNLNTSSCVITPQKLNILLNGIAVERRNSVCMDSTPQLPTVVSKYLKYGINLLQVVGQSNGDYIIIIAVMSTIPSSSLPIPPDYEQPVSAATFSSDSELVEGPSRVSLNCPISKTRITTPVKGNLCKHYQCFDLSNYVEMNNNRPVWRCPSCNQSVCFSDLRVDQKMVKALKDIGENVSEVMISVDGSWTAASSDKRMDESQNKTSANQLEGLELEESPVRLDDLPNILDLTGEDEVMDTDQCEPVDIKPVLHANVQGQFLPSNLNQLPVSGSTIELLQQSSAQTVSGTSPRAVVCNSSSATYNTWPQPQIGGTSGTFTGNHMLTPVLKDAVSPVLNRQADSFQGINYPMSSTYSQHSAPASSNVQLPDAVLYSQAIINTIHSIPRNVTRVPSAIQALPVQRPTTNLQQHSRPSVSLPTASGPSAPFQQGVGHANTHFRNSFGSNIERQRHLSQSFVNPQVPNMTTVSTQNRSISPVVSHSNPSHNVHKPQTLSQPPHLMRSSQLPRTSQSPLSHNQRGVGPRVGVSNSPSTYQSVHLLPSQGSHMRHLQSMPLQTQPVRTPPSAPSKFGGTPQAVSRTENLIDFHSEKNWRPTSRMRGALTGEAYSQALNQLGQAALPVQTPSSRPAVPQASTLPNLQVLLANRRVASEVSSQPATGSVNSSGTIGTPSEGSQKG
ncbi:E4 SUMO-protein ligase PIAL2-like isoform X2 [Amaranthus tricolor]|uniref:E4 SUMO-protein ligase PIAL2-like isoform X2 n=1 Tax=Amaranthus tricolor TaxID=29722 RepID=UPI002588A693|nr:E4 SUMO-protein ligase PIAL2-like isoform X2 [Amaranthus tricolor]